MNQDSDFLVKILVSVDSNLLFLPVEIYNSFSQWFNDFLSQIHDILILFLRLTLLDIPLKFLYIFFNLGYNKKLQI